MKKLTAILLGAALMISLASCSNTTDNQPITERQSERVSNNSGSIDTNQQDNILIAYFTWAENTHVENPESIDVDATTSASVLPPGNTARLANWIQEYTGGDLFSIVVTEPYSSDYDECLERAADEKAANARPELTNHLENVNDYDVIFLGFPDWWYTAPMAVFSFIEAYDFSGKTVIPFCAHGTSGLASSIIDITAALPDSTEVLEPIGVYREDMESAQPTVRDWLTGLGFTESAEAPEDSNEVEAAARERPIKLMVDSQEYSAVLYDSAAANALYDMLPLELTFEDFNQIEKIAYLPEDLVTDEKTNGFEPAVGDICLYQPWGNISIFYQPFRHSEELISLGRIESGIDVLSDMPGDFIMTLEKAE